MITPVFVADCTLPPISEREVLRYTGDRMPSEKTVRLLRDCIVECNDRFHTRVAYRVFPIERGTDCLSIGGLKLYSKDLLKNLEKCDQVILFAASAGIETDRLIKKYSAISPSRALMLHSIGTERVEALCDAFCKWIAKDQRIALCPRFSCGYGDLPLTIQKDLLHLLNANQTVGICLNDSLMISPSKSVTAFAGIINSERT